MQANDTKRLLASFFSSTSPILQILEAQVAEHIRSGLQLSVENSALHRMRAKAESVLLAQLAAGTRNA